MGTYDRELTTDANEEAETTPRPKRKVFAYFRTGSGYFTRIEERRFGGAQSARENPWYTEVTKAEFLAGQRERAFNRPATWNIYLRAPERRAIERMSKSAGYKRPQDYCALVLSRFAADEVAWERMQLAAAAKEPPH